MDWRRVAQLSRGLEQVWLDHVGSQRQHVATSKQRGGRNKGKKEFNEIASEKPGTLTPGARLLFGSAQGLDWNGRNIMIKASVGGRWLDVFLFRLQAQEELFWCKSSKTEASTSFGHCLLDLRLKLNWAVPGVVAFLVSV